MIVNAGAEGLNLRRAGRVVKGVLRMRHGNPGCNLVGGRSRLGWMCRRRVVGRELGLGWRDVVGGVGGVVEVASCMWMGLLLAVESRRRLVWGFRWLLVEVGWRVCWVVRIGRVTGLRLVGELEVRLRGLMVVVVAWVWVSIRLRL